MSKMEKKIKIPFWLQIAAILMLGVISGVVVRIVLSEPAQPVVTHTVTFAQQDGTVLDTKEASHGNGVIPPEYPCEGVFRGWSGGINSITSDVEVHPMVYHISEDNLFYFNSVYVQEGDVFELDICLGGSVSLSRGKLKVLYDPEVLHYSGAASDGLCQISEGDAGELIISIDSEPPIREACILAQLKFRALEKDAYATEIQLNATDVELVTQEQTIPAACATINNKIYFLQEVG